MALVITNGTYYIATNEHGGIIKTLKMKDAQQFYNVNVAMKKIRKAPGKCKGYYVFDTDGDDKPSTGKKTKRKKYSEQERKMIYIRDDGRCALCGRKITLSEMTIDHIVPLDKNGEDSINNLQSTCLACNRFKANIRPDDFMDRIATVYKGNIIKNLIMDCQSYTKYRPNETTGGIFVSWRRKEELPTGA